MIVFMLNDPGRQTRKGFFMVVEIFIQITQGQHRISVYVFIDVGNAQTTFVKRPFFALFMKDFRIDKNSFKIL